MMRSILSSYFFLLPLAVNDSHWSTIPDKMTIDKIPMKIVYTLITFLAKEVMFFAAFVCLSVCLFVYNITPNIKNRLG